MGFSAVYNFCQELKFKISFCIFKLFVVKNIDVFVGIGNNILLDNRHYYLYNFMQLARQIKTQIITIKLVVDIIIFLHLPTICVFFNSFFS